MLDKIDTAFTYLNKDTELFKVVNVPMQDTMKEYVDLAAQTSEEQKEYFTGPIGNYVFQCSPMPWVAYTHIPHTNSGKKDNRVRRIMQHLCLTGGNIAKRMGGLLFQCRFRHIILL